MDTTRITTRLALAAMLSLSISAAYAGGEGDHNAFDYRAPGITFSDPTTVTAGVGSSAHPAFTNNHRPPGPNTTLLGGNGGSESIVQTANSAPPGFSLSPAELGRITAMALARASGPARAGSGG